MSQKENTINIEDSKNPESPMLLSPTDQWNLWLRLPIEEHRRREILQKILKYEEEAKTQNDEIKS